MRAFLFPLFLRTKGLWLFPTRQQLFIEIGLLEHKAVIIIPDETKTCGSRAAEHGGFHQAMHHECSAEPGAPEIDPFDVTINELCIG